MISAKNLQWTATGRRKSSVARVIFRKGKGKFLEIRKGLKKCAKK